MKELLAKHEQRYICEIEAVSKKVKNGSGGFLFFTGKKREAEEIYLVISSPASPDREFLIRENLTRATGNIGADSYEYRFGQAI
jgi:hypothetical protein